MQQTTGTSNDNGHDEVLETEKLTGNLLREAGIVGHKPQNHPQFGKPGKQGNGRIHSWLVTLSEPLNELLKIGRSTGSSHLKHFVRIVKNVLRRGSIGKKLNLHFNDNKGIEAAIKEEGITFSEMEHTGIMRLINQIKGKLRGFLKQNELYKFKIESVVINGINELIDKFTETFAQPLNFHTHKIAWLQQLNGSFIALEVIKN